MNLPKYNITSGLPDKWWANDFEWFFMFLMKTSIDNFFNNTELLDGQYGTARNTAKNFCFSPVQNFGFTAKLFWIHNKNLTGN